MADTTSTMGPGHHPPMAVATPEDEGKPIHINIDNVTVVSALRKRRSDDRLAHALISAVYLVAGALGCRLFVTWVNRRSKVPTKIADDPHTQNTPQLWLGTIAWMSTYYSGLLQTVTCVKYSLISK